jgi:hypothetical protein
MSGVWAHSGFRFTLIVEHGRVAWTLAVATTQQMEGGREMKHVLGKHFWKTRTFMGFMFVVGGLLAMSCTEQSTSIPAATDNSILTKPPGVVLGDKLVYKFNLIGYPADKEYTGGCGSGHRIFVNRDARHAHVLLTDTNDGWWVEDCNATRDNWASLHTDDAAVYFIYVRILGKPGGHLNICADTLYDDGTTHADECYLGEIDLTRDKGRSNFSIQPSSIFDASLENIVWSVETNSNFRMAEFRVYR